MHCIPFISRHSMTESDMLRQLLALDDQNPMTWFNIGDCYYEMAEDEKSNT